MDNGVLAPVCCHFAVRCLQHLPTEAEALKNFLKAGCGVNFACVSAVTR